jgi:hypothetical protein
MTFKEGMRHGQGLRAFVAAVTLARDPASSQTRGPCKAAGLPRRTGRPLQSAFRG